MNAADRKRQAIIAYVAKALHDERLRQGLSMSAVAQRAGLSQQMVSYVERQMRMPTLDTTLRMAESLQIALEDILRNAR